METEQISNLVDQIRALPEKNRELLFNTLGLKEKSLPVGVMVRIHDMKGRYRQRPIVEAKYPDEREEFIDVIETITQNAISIGHPLILHAIRRWEGVVRFFHAFAREPRGAVRTAERPARTKIADNYKTALTHLENIGKALIQGAKDRCLTLEQSFETQARNGGVWPNYGHLSMVWKLMKKREFKYKPLGDGLEKERTESERLSYIRRGLVEEWKRAGVSETDSRTSLMIDFLKSPEGNKFLNRQAREREFVNAFDAWRFSYSTRTVSRYHSVAKQQELIRGDFRYLMPDEVSIFSYSEIKDWLSFPLVYVEGAKE